MKRNLRVIVVSIFLASLSFYTWFFLFPIFLQELGAGDRDIALTYTILTICLTAGQYFGGLLSDRIGRKPTLTYPTFVNAFLVFFLSLSASWKYALYIMALMYLSFSIQIPAYTAIVGESVNGEKGKAFGWSELSYVLGCATGPFIGALLLNFMNLREIMQVSALIVLFTAFLRFFMLEETAPEEAVDKAGDKIFTEIFVIFLVAGIFVFLADSITVYGPFIALHMKEFLTLDEKKINLLFSLGAFAQAFISIFAGKISDRIGYVKSLALGMVGHTVLLVLWSFLTDRALAYSIFPIAVMFIQFTYISYQVILNLITEPGTRGRAIGIFGTITGLISAAGPLVGHALKREIGPQGPFIGAFIFALISLVFLSLLKKRAGEGIIGL